MYDQFKMTKLYVRNASPGIEHKHDNMDKQIKRILNVTLHLDLIKGEDFHNSQYSLPVIYEQCKSMPETNA